MVYFVLVLFSQGVWFWRKCFFFSPSLFFYFRCTLRIISQGEWQPPQHLCQTRRLLMRRALHFQPEYISILYEDSVSFCSQPSTTTVLRKIAFFFPHFSLHPFLYVLIIRCAISGFQSCPSQMTLVELGEILFTLPHVYCRLM